MRKLLRGRVIAPVLHALLFAIAFPLAQVSTSALGPARLPLFILWLADLPFSIVAQVWSLGASQALRPRIVNAVIAEVESSGKADRALVRFRDKSGLSLSIRARNNSGNPGASSRARLLSNLDCGLNVKSGRLEFRL